MSAGKTKGTQDSWLVDRRLPPLAAALLVVCCACAGQASTRPTATPVALDSARDVQVVLEQAAGKSRLGDPLDAAAWGVQGREVWIGEERLRVFEVSGSAAREAVIARLQTESQTRVWQLDRLLIAYAGSDGGTVLLLSGLLGDADFGPTAAGAEPYPPAVAAAVVAAAEVADTNPAQVEVVSYRANNWADGCLGLADPGESCSPGPVEGWVILLRAERRDFEVHCDQLGAEVRLR